MPPLLRYSAGLSALRQFSTSHARAFSRVSILGNISRAPEVRKTAADKPYLKYSMVYSRPSRDKDTEKTFIDVYCFNDNMTERAVTFLTSLKPGTPIFLEGDISFYTGQDAQGNKTRRFSIHQKALHLIPKPAPKEERDLLERPPSAIHEEAEAVSRGEIQEGN